MRISIEFYIPVENIDKFNNGEVVLYSPIPANGLIKITTHPNNIVFIQKVNSNIYYIRKATFNERRSLKKRRKL